MANVPKAPALQAPALLAGHDRRINRLEGSRDALTSQMNKTAPQAATALATANTASSGVTAINTRLGMADLAFLATLGEMSHIADPGGGFSHSGVGVLGSPPTAAQFNSVNACVNNLVDGVNLLVTKVDSLLAELQSSGFMA